MFFRIMGKSRYHTRMALFHYLRTKCNKQIFHRQWTTLLDSYADVKCQMCTQNSCLAIDDLKRTVTTVNKALPTIIPLVQESLTSYSLQCFLVQVDMGIIRYQVLSYKPETVERVPRNGVDHAISDGSHSHMLDGFVPIAKVQDRWMQTATILGSARTPL